VELVENDRISRSITTPLQSMNNIEESHLTSEVVDSTILVASKKGGEVQGLSTKYNTKIVSKVVEKVGALKEL
jgi:hypothetical protein